MNNKIYIRNEQKKIVPTKALIDAVITPSSALCVSRASQNRLRSLLPSPTTGKSRP